MVDYRVLVEEFSREMLKRLLEKRRDYGDSWLDVSIPHLCGRLVEEFFEWIKTSYPWGPSETIDEEMRELVDIANQALLIYHRLKMHKKDLEKVIKNG